MPHTRNRHILAALIKKLGFSPVVAIQGVRQSGKSVLVKELLPKRLKKAKYETFDRKLTREFATTNPETFLIKNHEFHPIIIDEAQKVPDIFDAIKYQVDQKRIPGTFLLLGSTEFSKATLIAESLTGRMSRIRIFPMTLSETLSQKFRPVKILEPFNKENIYSRRELIKYLDNGGMPAIFYIHSSQEKTLSFEDWVRLTVERDLHQIPKLKLDSELARRILEKVATLDEPSAGRIAADLGKDLRKISNHLDAFEILFVLNKLSPYPGSTGKPLYYLCDVGLADFLGASFPRKLETYLLLHVMASIHYQSLANVHLSFFRSSKGSFVQLLISEREKVSAIRILPEEKIDMRELLGLISLQKKISHIKMLAYGPERVVLKEENINIYPWESLG